jgi:hypothetical protein
MRVGTFVRGAVERCLFSRPASRAHLIEQWACRAQDYFETRNGMAGADYSSKFSAWLAHGCISPRFVHAEAQRYERERVKNKSTYWLTFELEWRDFFRCDPPPPLLLLLSLPLTLLYSPFAESPPPPSYSSPYQRPRVSPQGSWRAPRPAHRGGWLWLRAGSSA